MFSTHTTYFCIFAPFEEEEKKKLLNAERWRRWLQPLEIHRLDWPVSFEVLENTGRWQAKGKYVWMKLLYGNSLHLRNIQCFCDQRKATYHVVTISHNSSRPAFKSCLLRAVRVPATTLCTLCDAYLLSPSLYPSRKGKSTPILQTKQVRLREKFSDLPRVTWVAYVGAGLHAG